MDPKALVFTVRRQKPELIAPAKPTPHETKFLSDVDDQDGLRFQLPGINFYRKDPSMGGIDPVKVIKDAIAKTLVFYYPLAGRLREGNGRKLMVDCTAEGVLFVEADADVTLDEFGDQLYPPFPCFQELLYDVPGSGGILHCPLVLVQVTRLRCGGFIFAIRLNHTIVDAYGLFLFMTAVGEMARGATAPSTLPLWCRELLSARNPPQVTCTHPAYDEIPDAKGTIIPLPDLVHKSFFFGPSEISILRQFVPLHLRNCSIFELLTSVIWRCRTISLKYDPEEEVRVICIVNARRRFNPQVPNGYYGNTSATPVAVTTVEKLCKNPLGYALELVKKIKADVTEEYVKSMVDLLVIKGRPHYSVVRTYVVSDLTGARFDEINFGWGKAVYGGLTEGLVDLPGVVSLFLRFKNKKGENGVLVPVCLPAISMERFVKELDAMLKAYPPLFNKNYVSIKRPAL